MGHRAAVCASIRTGDGISNPEAVCEHPAWKLQTAGISQHNIEKNILGSNTSSKFKGKRLLHFSMMLIMGDALRKNKPHGLFYPLSSLLLMSLNFTELKLPADRDC